MRELTLQEIQQTELELLKQYDTVCKELGLRYSLGGGSLLGAVRHRGFIPWDDDIDVMMPRPDYDRFIAYCGENSTPFTLITYENTQGYNGLFAKLSDPGTRIEDSVMKMDYEMGVNIDVFPLEGLGQSEEEAVRIFRKTELNREILNAYLWKKFFRSKTHSVVYEPIRLAMYMISRVADPKKLLRKVDRINRSHSFEDAGFAGCVCGSYRLQEIMKQSTFTEYVELPFEGLSLMAIRDYDAYLTKHYGDYMQLPPEDKRETHHTYKAYVL